MIPQIKTAGVLASIAKTLLPYLIVLGLGGWGGWALYDKIYTRGYNAAQAECNSRMLALQKQVDYIVLDTETYLKNLASDLKKSNGDLIAEVDRLKSQRPKVVVETIEREVDGKKVQECTPSAEYLKYINSVINTVNSAGAVK